MLFLSKILLVSESGHEMAGQLRGALVDADVDSSIVGHTSVGTEPSLFVARTDKVLAIRRRVTSGMDWLVLAVSKLGRAAGATPWPMCLRFAGVASISPLCTAASAWCIITDGALLLLGGAPEHPSGCFEELIVL